jgi:hypothetical protein
MTVPVCSGSAFHLDEDGAEPTSELVVVRSPGFVWPGLGSILIVTALSTTSILTLKRSSGGVWALGWSQDVPPEGVGGEGHGRLWWQHVSAVAMSVEITIGLDPPGFGMVALYEVEKPTWMEVNPAGSAVSYPAMTEEDLPEVNRSFSGDLAEASMGFVSERFPHASEEGGAVGEALEEDR